MRKALAGPLGISTRIFKRNPGDWLLGRTVRITSVLPILEKVLVVRWMIMCRVEEVLELRVGDRESIDVDRL